MLEQVNSQTDLLPSYVFQNDANIFWLAVKFKTIDQF